MVEDRPSAYQHISSILATEHSTELEATPNAALFRAAEGDYDLLIVSLGLKNFDGSRLCSQVRSLERTRSMPILAVSVAKSRLLPNLQIGGNVFG